MVVSFLNWLPSLLQLVLGLTFNWGALMGWVAVHNELQSGAWVVAPLYTGAVAWTLLYDTIYAHQDKHDDAKLGLGSTALTLGDGISARIWLAFFGCSTVAGLFAAGHAAGLPVLDLQAGSPFTLMLGLVAAHLGWQVATVDFDNRADCAAKFISNQHVGALIFVGCAAGKWLCCELSR